MFGLYPNGAAPNGYGATSAPTQGPGTISADQAFGYAIRNAISADKAYSYALRARVQADQQFSYQILGGNVAFTPSVARTVKVLPGKRAFVASGDFWNMDDPSKPRGLKDPNSTI